MALSLDGKAERLNEASEKSDNDTERYRYTVIIVDVGGDHCRRAFVQRRATKCVFVVVDSGRGRMGAGVDIQRDHHAKRLAYKWKA
jgi:hypothetical protein